MAIVKISANLSDEIVDDMRRRAEEQGISMTELLRQALATQKFLEDEREGGTRLVLRREGEMDREVVGTPSHYRRGKS